MAASAETLIPNQPKTVDDDWTIVMPRRRNNRTKYLKLKPATQQQQQEQKQTHWTPTDLETTTESELKLMQKIQISISKLEKSRFFTTFLDQIQTEASGHFQKLTDSNHKLKMVIYGIGSIESFESPRVQLSLAILLKRKLDWIGEIEVFDPIISLTESTVFEKLGFRVLSVNENGCRKADDPILFFMPHCEVGLYDNLLKTNWKYDMLNRIVLLGNSFEKYEEYKGVFGRTKFDDFCKHIIMVRPFTKEFRIDTIDDYFGAFNGSSWHFFNVDPDSNLELAC